MRRLSLATAASALVAATVAASVHAAVFTYTVERRGSARADLGSFARVGAQALNDERGWSLGGAVRYRRVRSGGDFRLILASPQAVNRAAAGCSAAWSCTVGDQVLINDRRFRFATSSWTRSLGEYQQYVVNHEVGHWLGLSHRDCAGNGDPARVMQQQSISLNGCRANVWPLGSEKAQVAEIRGLARGEGPFLGTGFTPVSASADFNGDGFEDLALGVPGEDLGRGGGAGAVTLVYGSAQGPNPGASRLIHQATAGVPGAPERGDEFGRALAAGDFDGDGFADLAVGTPGESIGRTRAAGMVIVLYGSPLGVPARADAIYQGHGIPGGNEVADRVGHALAAGEFNGDGRADLAVGAPYEDIGRIRRAGAVYVASGAAGGLIAGGSSRIVHQNTGGVAGVAEERDRMGLSVTAGDLNADGFDELAAGVPFESQEGAPDAGAVNVLFGTSAGIAVPGNVLRSQAENDVAGGPEFGDRLGQSVAIGDGDGDGFGDLVAGVPGEGIGRIADAGAINIFRGSAGGMAPNGSLTHQGSPGVPGANELGDGFGWSVAVGDTDGDRWAAIVVGVPDEDVGRTQRAGMVTVIRTAGVSVFHQASPGVPGAPEAGDGLGQVVTIRDFDNDGRGDVVAAAPGEAIGRRDQAGAVTVVMGAPGGPDTNRSSTLHQGTPGIAGGPERLDALGTALG